MLYKYMKREFAEKFFREGSLKIGTLFEYKKNEKFNDAIGDKNEGSHYPFIKINDIGLNSKNITPDEAFFICGDFTLPPGSGLSNMTIQQEIKSDDCYIFCLTTSPSFDAMKEFECDTCIEISNHRTLFRLMTNKISQNITELTWKGRITYQNKTYPFNAENGINPAITKDLKYAYQNEFRVIWTPKDDNSGQVFLNPLYINVPEARRFCKKITLK